MLVYNPAGPWTRGACDMCRHTGYTLLRVLLGHDWGGDGSMHQWCYYDVQLTSC
jgi:hypothetical protein